MQQIIDAHHGRIWIESDDGKGTSIRFILPLLHHTKPEVKLEATYSSHEENLMN